MILLMTFNNLNAQTDEQIINEILFDLFGFHQDTIFMENIITKTYFWYDSVSFEKATGLTVPSRVISEWNNNEENQDFSAQWKVQYFNKIDTLFLDKDTVIGKKPLFKCLSKLEIDQLFEQTNKRQNIYSISKILFDNSKEKARLRSKGLMISDFYLLLSSSKIMF